MANARVAEAFHQYADEEHLTRLLSAILEHMAGRQPGSPGVHDADDP
jgi:hypothetical protein